MSLFKYRLFYRENAVYELDNYLKLTREQKEIIYRDGYWLPFVLLKDIKDKKVPPFLDEVDISIVTVDIIGDVHLHTHQLYHHRTVFI